MSRRLLAPCALLGTLVVVLGLPPSLSSSRRALAGNTYRLTGSPEAIFEEIQKIQERKDAEAALPLLEASVEFPDTYLAVAAGEALRAMPQDVLETTLLAGSAFPKWLKSALKAKEDREQVALAHVLGTWGHPTLDEAMAYLASGRRSPEVQVAGLMMAGSLRPSKERPFAKTREAINDGLRKGRNQEILCAAASAAGRWRDSSFTDPLLGIVKGDRDPYPGLYAVWALKEIGYAGGVGSFIYVASKSPKRTTLQANLKAITELATPADVDELLGLSRSSKQDLRDAAVLALGRMPWRWVRGRLPGQVGGAEAVVTGGSDAAPVIRPLPSPTLDVPDKVIDRLLQIVGEDSSWEVRDAARQGLLRYGTRAAEKVLAKVPALVTSNDADVAQTAVELCGLFGAKDAFDDVLKIAMFEQKNRALRMFAYRALEGVDPERAIQELREAIRPRPKAKDSELSAVRALGYIRTKASFDLLVDLLTSVQPYSEEMQREAELALERQTGHRFGRLRSVWVEWFDRVEHPFLPRRKQFNRAANREAAIGRGLFGVTPATERAVESGLAWLARQQHGMGQWDGNEKGFAGIVNCEPAYTGLALLTFLGAGYLTDHGKYCEQIRRGAEFLAATQFYDGSYPVTGGGDDSWIFAYVIGMAVWGLNEAYGAASDSTMADAAQWGIDYLVRTQTPGAGWRYGARYVNSDTSATSWVLMATKMADIVGLDVAQKSWDGVDDWLERCTTDITGEIEKPEDLSDDYEHEVGIQRMFEAFTSYFEVGDADASGRRKLSMTAVGMVCRFFMGWKRSHPYMIGAANILLRNTPEWMSGPTQDQSLQFFHYYWYYGTLAMHQMGGKYWRAWNQKIKKMYPEHQRLTPDELAGSWDPDATRFNGGRLFSTPLSIMSLEAYYRFSPLLGEKGADDGHGNGKDAGAPGAGAPDEGGSK
ncbi:MAG: hypothetical protein H6826_05905 [Planctomycetes bacterium]|nr:hypothetical protein [Planctomycetota bacterium]MCB9825389.1 hypothetical protein [Planctomycetota bacterium]MCB9900871.1 hypothetical protein [Planctomycetota bacterium]